MVVTCFKARGCGWTGEKYKKSARPVHFEIYFRTRNFRMVYKGKNFIIR